MQFASPTVQDAKHLLGKLDSHHSHRGRVIAIVMNNQLQTNTTYFDQITLRAV